MTGNGQKMVLWGFMPCRIINLFRRFAFTLELIYYAVRYKKPIIFYTAKNKHKELPSSLSRNFWVADFEPTCPTERAVHITVRRIICRLTTDKIRSMYLSCGHLQVGFRCPRLSTTLIIYWTEYLKCQQNQQAHILCKVAGWWSRKQLERNKCGGGMGRWDSILGTLFYPSNKYWFTEGHF